MDHCQIIVDPRRTNRQGRRGEAAKPNTRELANGWNEDTLTGHLTQDAAVNFHIQINLRQRLLCAFG